MKLVVQSQGKPKMHPVQLLFLLVIIGTIGSKQIKIKPAYLISGGASGKPLSRLARSALATKACSSGRKPATRARSS